jgi:hypothetical protein
MTCTLMFPLLLAALMHVPGYGPGTIAGLWLALSYALAMKFYPLVLTVWITQFKLQMKIRRIAEEDLTAILNASAQGRMQTMNMDVEERAKAVQNGGGVTQTVCPCAFKDFMVYVAHVMKKISDSNAPFNFPESDRWTAKLVVIMHSHMRFQVYLSLFSCIPLVLAWAFCNYAYVYVLFAFLRGNKISDRYSAKALVKVTLTCVQKGICEVVKTANA